MSESGWPAIVAHRERLLRIARRRCPTLQDAEDVVHEAMVRCATFADLDEARLGQFLTSVTVRLCADVYRRADRTHRAFGRLAPDTVEQGPEDAACRAADAAVLADLLSTLPDRQRAVLVDRAHGLSMAQICSRRGLTYKAAESALARARGAMRVALTAALSAAAGGVATLRRTRVSLATLPVAAIVVAGSVLHLPVSGPGPGVPLPHGARGGITDAASRETVVGHGLVTARRAAGRSGVRSSPGAGRRPSAAPVARGHHHEVVGVGVRNDDHSVRASVTDDRPPEPPQDFAARCVRQGAWIEVGDPLDVSPHQGCGRPPGPDRSVTTPGAEPAIPPVTIEGAHP
ncbi:MAG: hypothetical protein QOE45_2308 [Frankiaceae bacterium]|jgi:RNA polymerase sigma factor (sigma-70 family)|nr:hypothetical protein [Frankiaceae bacterium]